MVNASQTLGGDFILKHFKLAGLIYTNYNILFWKKKYSFLREKNENQKPKWYYNEFLQVDPPGNLTLSDLSHWPKYKSGQVTKWTCCSEFSKADTFKLSPIKQQKLN